MCHVTRRDNCPDNRGLAWTMWGHMTICCCCCICNRMKKGKSHKLLYDGIAWICQRGEMANFRMAHVVTEYSKNKKNKKSGKFPDLTATHNALRRSNKSHSEVITLPSPASHRTAGHCLLPVAIWLSLHKKEARKQKFLVFSLPTFGNLLPAVCCDKKLFFFSLDPGHFVVLFDHSKYFHRLLFTLHGIFEKKEQEKQSFVRLIIFRGKKTELSLFVFYCIYRVFGSSAFFANPFQVVFLKFVVLWNCFICSCI